MYKIINICSLLTLNLYCYESNSSVLSVSFVKNILIVFLTIMLESYGKKVCDNILNHERFMAFGILTIIVINMCFQWGKYLARKCFAKDFFCCRMFLTLHSIFKQSFYQAHICRVFIKYCVFSLKYRDFLNSVRHVGDRPTPCFPTRKYWQRG